MKPRFDKQIGWLSVLAMLLVVIGHSAITDHFYSTWLYNWIYSFHMPLFMFVSGFLFCLTTGPDARFSYGRLIRKKVQRLLLPFLFINSVSYFIKAHGADSLYVQNAPVEGGLHSFIEATFFNPIGYMWFLPALFAVFCITAAAAKFIPLKGGGYGRLVHNGRRSRYTLLPAA